MLFVSVVFFRTTTQLVRYYATPSGTIGLRFMSILAVECQGVLDRSCNSKIPLVFAHVILKRCWVSAGPGILGHKSQGVCTSGIEVSTKS